MSDFSITYRPDGKKLQAELLAPSGCTTENDPALQIAFVVETAAKLIPKMNKDIVADDEITVAGRPASYRQFSALQWLACEIDNSGKCPADWGTIFKQSVAAPDGTEPRAGQIGSFVIDYHGLSVRVDYDPDWCGATDHITMRSIAPEKQPLPISETGFRSHFLSRAEVIAAGGVQNFVHAYLDWGAKENADWGQQSLF